MDELRQELAAEKERIEETLAALAKILRRKRRGFAELAAIATCLHNCYGIALQEAPLQPLAQNLPGIWQQFESELGNFLTTHQKQ